MKRMWVVFFIAVLVLAPVLSASTTPGPAVGGVLPEFSLKAPQDAAQRAYLGLDGKDSFSIADIQAEVVVIEIFSMY